MYESISIIHSKTGQKLNPDNATLRSIDINPYITTNSFLNKKDKKLFVGRDLSSTFKSDETHNRLTGRCSGSTLSWAHRTSARCPA